MAQSSGGGGGGVPLIGVGIGGFYIFRVVQQLRRRAINPDMTDPARNLMRWIQALAMAVVALVVGVAIALLWWMGPVGIVFALGFAVLTLILGVVAALYLWAYAESQRRASGYMICEIHYPDAPRPVKASMRRIYRASRSVQSGSAFQHGMFGDIELDRLVYSAAERAVVSSELSEAIRDLRPDSRAEDRAVLEDGNAQIEEITAFLAAAEKTLKRSASTADQLSEHMTEPERRRENQHAAEQQAVAKEDRRQRARTRLDEANRRAATLEDVNVDDVADRISAVHLGYAEAAQASENVLAPKLGHDEGSAQRPQSDSSTEASESAITSEALLRAAKSSAGRFARLSTAAAKSGVEKLRKGQDER